MKVTKDKNSKDKRGWRRQPLVIKHDPLRPLPEWRIEDDPIGLFIHLSEQVIPHEFEAEYYGAMLKKLGWRQLACGNYYYTTNRKSTTLFCAHLDTATLAVRDARLLAYKEQGGDWWIKTDGTTILGADDRVGVTVVLYLAHVARVPAHYMLFIGEECGGIGVNRAVKQKTIPRGIKLAIEVDRRGTEEIIIAQRSEYTASEECAEDIAHALGMGHKPSENGAYTDVADLAHVVPECVNIAAGYESAHTVNERTNLSYLYRLTQAMARVDWSSIRIARDPSRPKFVEYDWSDFDWSTMRWKTTPTKWRLKDDRDK